MLGWCGIAAVISANIVIAAYVRMAWLEDRHENKRAIDNNKVPSKNPEKRTD